MIRPIPLLLFLAAASVSHASTVGPSASIIAPSSGTYVNPAGVQLLPGPFPVMVPASRVVPDGSLGTVSVTSVLDGSGLSGVPTLANYTSITHATPNFTGSAANAWASVDTGLGGGDFYSDLGAEMSSWLPSSLTNGPAGYFDLRFDTPVTLTDMVAWGYSFGGLAINGSNIREWQIDAYDSTGSLIGGGIFSHGAGSALDGSGPQTISFGRTFDNVSSINAYPLDNYYGMTVNSLSAIGGDRIGVAELRFIGTAVPEPSISLFGLGAAGLCLRRRRA